MASLFLISNLGGNDFIINSSGLIDQRAYEKINTIGKEVESKIGVKIFLDVKGDNGIKIDLPREERLSMMKQKENELILKIKQDFNETKPFVVLTIALDQQYANILMSEDFKGAINKNDILDGYVIPLLAAKDKNSLNSKVSAATLNGYAEISDELAKNKGTTLVSSIGSEGKIASTIWKVFMYTIVVVGILLYILIIMKEKKIKGRSNNE
ncbi:MAG: hypothetical protein HY307_00250 [Arcobacter sp.]|nr:hypothetical protein [Arcobacter sp.]